MQRANLFRKVATSGPWIALVDQSICSLSTFLTAAVLARTSAPSEFGLFQLLFALQVVIGGIASALVNEPTRVYGIGLEAEKERSYVSAQLAIRVALALFTSCILGVVAMVTTTVDVAGAGACAISFATLQISDLIRTIHSIRLQWIELLLGDVINHFVRLGIIVVLAAGQDLTVQSVFMAMAAGSVAGTGTGLLCGIQFVSLTKKTLRSTMESNWRYGKWMVLDSVLNALSNHFYVFMIAAWMSVEAVAAFAAAQTLVNAFNVILVGVTAYSMSTVRAALVRGGINMWKLRLLTAVRVLSLGAICVGGALSLVGRDVMGAIYGEQYGDYWYLIPFLSCAMLLTCWNSVLGVAFRTVEMPWAAVGAKSVAAVATCTLAYPLITTLGVLGAAVGIVAAQSAWLITYGVQLGGLRRTLRERYEGREAKGARIKRQCEVENRRL